MGVLRVAEHEHRDKKKNRLMMFEKEKGDRVVYVIRGVTTTEDEGDERIVFTGIEVARTKS
jgi:hypothetical protein